MHVSFFTVLAVQLLVGMSSATTCGDVKKQYKAQGCCGNPAQPFQPLMKAPVIVTEDDDLAVVVATASPGDEIILSDGSYKPTMPIFIDKNIVMRAKNQGKATIHGNQEILSYISGGVVQFHGLNIAGGSSSAGVAIGGGIVTFTDCGFHNNTGSYGGALFIGGGTLTMVRCDIYNNKAIDGYGAGIFATSMGDGTTIFLKNCKFHNNEAEDMGGGLMIVGSSTRAFLEHCDIVGNQATTQDGGGVLVQGAMVVFTHCNIYSNNAGGLDGQKADTGSGNGGGLAIWGGMVQFDNCKIYGNHARQGGGLIIFDTFPLPIDPGPVIKEGSLIVTKSKIYDNTAREMGGAVCIAMGATATLENCTLYGNTANSSARGPAAYITSVDGDGDITGTLTLVRTSVSNDEIYHGPPPSVWPWLTNTTFTEQEMCYTEIGASAVGALYNDEMASNFLKGILEVDTLPPAPNKGDLVPPPLYNLLKDDEEFPDGAFELCGSRRLLRIPDFSKVVSESASKIAHKEW